MRYLSILTFIILLFSLDQTFAGDTIETATPIPYLPFIHDGNTCDYINDYDENCPYTYAGLAEDFVYAYTPAVDEIIDIDTCGSAYDSKLFVYENEWAIGVPYACIEDYYVPNHPCGDYVARLESLPVFAGNTYYIVIDGYMEQCGYYTISVSGESDCQTVCPPAAMPEGEPPLVWDYNDLFNSGCGGEPEYPFQNLSGDANNCLTLCGVSGWYVHEGSITTDGDWYEVVASGEQISWTVASQYETLMSIYLPDCELLDTLAQAVVPSCLSQDVVLPTTPGAVFWLRIGPTYDPGPLREYDYVMEICGIMDPSIATNVSSWGHLKAIYR